MSGNLHQQILPEEKNWEISPTIDPNNKHVSDGSPDITLVATLSYLNKILLEEDIDEKNILYSNESALYAMEKHFYDILDHKYFPPGENPQQHNHTKSGPSSTDEHFTYLHGSNFGTLSSSDFIKGMEEGIRFLPRIDKLALGTEAKKLSLPLLSEEDSFVKINSVIDDDKNNEDFRGCGSTGKKKPDVDLDLLEGRNCKISTPYSEEPSRNEMFDDVLLDHANYREISNVQNGNKNKRSKYYENDQVGNADVMALLVECSHAVYTNDRILAEGLLNQIRKLASLDGDGTQRMAFVFADALEARMNGIGSEAWRRILSRRISTSEFLKVARLYITVCPFPRISMYYANQTIFKLAEKVSKLHIIDFGIGFGFQWPSLIQALSNMNNCKSKKLRITGIDFPSPGFRPSELIQETGRRLETYAESFGVPFQYHAIASKWEDVSVDDLKIKEDEVLIVNCMHRFWEVGDEAVSIDSPRNQVLDLIRRIRPYVFIEDIVSIGPFSPFFISHFKQGLILYSALFELFDTLIPRDDKQRQFVERNVLAGDIHNVLACEGSNWIVKPETYKQWHLRNLRAGLKQIPLDATILKECKERMKRSYNNNIFFIEEDRNWLLQGWNGRRFKAMSTWKAS
jgi:GRAS domain family